MPGAEKVTFVPESGLLVGFPFSDTPPSPGADYTFGFSSRFLLFLDIGGAVGRGVGLQGSAAHVIDLGRKLGPIFAESGATWDFCGHTDIRRVPAVLLGLILSRESS